MPTAEHLRLQQLYSGQTDWDLWGPYLSERAWGTLREHYTPNLHFWDDFTHDQSRSRAYRWGEDGIAGISDKNQYLCFALSLWNGQDPILKERYFGLTNPQGNHGEDVKDYYFYLDNTPTHSYMKTLYKYPHAAYPYEEILIQNAKRGLLDPEFELEDTNIFQHGYTDVICEYAKADENDLCILITATNRGSKPTQLWVLPTLWFRNTWAWGYPNGPQGATSFMPKLSLIKSDHQQDIIQSIHPTLGNYFLYFDHPRQLLFTENETNYQRLYGLTNRTKYTKDAFHRFLIDKKSLGVNPAHEGTKAAALYHIIELKPQQSHTIKLRLSPGIFHAPFQNFHEILAHRREEADQFYHSLHHEHLPDHQRQIQRQAWSSLLFTKQFYYFDVQQWLTGDPISVAPSRDPEQAANKSWTHLQNHDIILMPDKWEYPWYASWDLAFHCLAMAPLDLQFAKQQLELMVSERYLHPNGQIPAFENELDSANPPVLTWAVWQLYESEKKSQAKPDLVFLEKMFQKCLLNFGWWVNRKDLEGRNIFQGGFLGLDNIGVIDRNQPIPGGGHLDQSDSTAWMAMYTLVMTKMAIELSLTNPVYQDMAIKFIDHFLRIVDATTHIDGKINLWNEEDGFYYDVLQFSDGRSETLRVRSLVGLLPLIATEIMEPEDLSQLPEFQAKLQQLIADYPHLVEAQNLASIELPGLGHRRLLSMVSKDRLTRILQKLLDEQEFLSPYGIRSLSKYHLEHPYCFDLHGHPECVDYQPGESRSRMFGGNSNWRGPIWFPLNYILIQSLRVLHRYYGDEIKVECPTGSGNFQSLDQVANQISQRLISLYLPSESHRPAHSHHPLLDKDPHWQNLLLFYEYFHADTGAGLGASHQTGWTALIANLINEISS